MKLKDLELIVDLLGECEIEPFESGFYVYDKNREKIGDVNFYERRFVLYDGYSKAEAVEQRFKDAGHDLFDRGLSNDLLHGEVA